MSLLGKCRAEMKEDKINTDGTIVYLNVTDLFPNLCGKEAHLKLRRPMSLIDTTETILRLLYGNKEIPMMSHFEVTKKPTVQKSCTAYAGSQAGNNTK